MTDVGKVTLSFETAPPDPYIRGIGRPLNPSVAGPEQLALLFETAGKRIHRRAAQRERALLPKRPRYRPLPERLTADSPVPKGWHLRGTCPDCKEA